MAHAAPADIAADRFLFVDLDGLLGSLKAHECSLPTHVGVGSDVILHASNFTTLLEADQPASVACRFGSYFNSNSKDVQALQAAGWSLTKKNLTVDRTLDDLLIRNLTETNPPKKTLVLATGELERSTVDSLLDKSMGSSPPAAVLATEAPTSSTFSSSQELAVIQRRQSRLVTQTNDLTAPANSQRFVAMNLDNIHWSLFGSQLLFQYLPGASSSRDLRLNFKALTDRVCTSSTSHLRAPVGWQFATYCTTHPKVADLLSPLGWKVTALNDADDGNTLYKELASQLSAAGSGLKGQKTLVLVMGNEPHPAFRELLAQYLNNGWCVEVHAWLHALKDQFLNLPETHPGRVVVRPLDDVFLELVYLKRRHMQPLFEEQGAVGNRGLSSTLPPPFDEELYLVDRQPPSSKYSSMGDQSLLEQELLDALEHEQMQNESLLQQNEMLAWSMEEQQSQLEDNAAHQAMLNQRIQQLEQRLQEQEQALTQERAQSKTALEQQACDNRLSRREALRKLEAKLCCPITREIYEAPVTTACCGQSFSGSKAMPADCCQWCKVTPLVTHRNRDLEFVMEWYNFERGALDAEDNKLDG
ncbi:hypothetical protein BBJ28_00001537 [Nothophytophthora sp. Chile5]|nr:hypothetical protein BBJ28_00001537 [Nothophytophthora sp. Chile5]